MSQVHVDGGPALPRNTLRQTRQELQVKTWRICHQLLRDAADGAVLCVGHAVEAIGVNNELQRTQPNIFLPRTFSLALTTLPGAWLGTSQCAKLQRTHPPKYVRRRRTGPFDVRVQPPSAQQFLLVIGVVPLLGGRAARHSKSGSFQVMGPVKYARTSHVRHCRK